MQRKIWKNNKPLEDREEAVDGDEEEE